MIVSGAETAPRRQLAGGRVFATADSLDGGRFLL
jgi:hypothetical protein